VIGALEEGFMQINGACHCGFITVEGEADPEGVAICHCTDCQTRTGSAFGMVVPVDGATFKMTGEPTTYLKTTAESGTPRIQAFCPKCGSSIYSTSPGEGRQASYKLRVGILAQRDQLAPKRQIWARSAQAWLAGLDAIPTSQKQA
jgi:hypothetical protein